MEVNDKKSVLFVDDEKNVVSALKRMLYPYRKEWELNFAESGSEALEIMKERKIDVVVTDIRMPHMGGDKLLKIIKNEFPEVIRITLSGFAEDRTTLHTARLAHQAIAKPADPDEIISTLKRAFKLRECLNNNKIQRLFNNLEQIPSLPEIYLELENEILSNNSSLKKISEIISKDPLITAKILQLTNSAFFGFPLRVNNIEQAVNFLGINLIKSLILTIKLFKLIDDKGSKVRFYQNIWQHSNQVALMSKHIAKIKMFGKEPEDDLFLAGLFHDIGKLILAENLDDYIETVNRIMQEEQCTYVEAERKFLDTDHAHLSAYLLGLWGFPDPIIAPILFHHDDSAVNVENLTAGSVLKISDTLINANVSVEEISGDNFNSVIEKYLYKIIPEKENE